VDRIHILDRDICCGEADLTIVPCSGKIKIEEKPRNQARIEFYGLPTPYDLREKFSFGRVSPLFRPSRNTGKIKYFAFAASVLNRSDVASIESIGRDIGIRTIENSDVRLVEAPFLGCGDGGLEPGVAVVALAKGFISTAHRDAILQLCSDSSSSGRLARVALDDHFRLGLIKNYQLNILFLAANPPLTSQLDLEEELRAISLQLQSTRYRDKITLTARHATRPDDLLRYIRSDSPNVLHFSGHGSPDGIILRDDTAGYRIVRGEALARLLRGRRIKLVILNACFSTEQARYLTEVVDTVIGTTMEVDDEAARRFSVAFYRTLGDGHQVGEAFRDGGDALELYDLRDVYQIIGKTDEQLVRPA